MKVKFKCNKHGVNFYWTQENKGKCTICHTPKIEEKNKK